MKEIRVRTWLVRYCVSEGNANNLNSWIEAELQVFSRGLTRRRLRIPIFSAILLNLASCEVRIDFVKVIPQSAKLRNSAYFNLKNLYIDFLLVESPSFLSSTKTFAKVPLNCLLKTNFKFPKDIPFRKFKDIELQV